MDLYRLRFDIRGHLAEQDEDALQEKLTHLVDVLHPLIQRAMQAEGMQNIDGTASAVVITVQRAK